VEAQDYCQQTGADHQREPHRNLVSDVFISSFTPGVLMGGLLHWCHLTFPLHAFRSYLTGFRSAAAGQSFGPTRGTFVCHYIVFCFAIAGHRDSRFATAAQMPLN
jgi:hypothetical protein